LKNNCAQHDVCRKPLRADLADQKNYICCTARPEESLNLTAFGKPKRWLPFEPLNCNMPLKEEIKFKSKFSAIFYVFLLLLSAVFSFSIFKVTNGDLDWRGFLFINLISFCIAYFLSLRWDCRISLIGGILQMKYVLPFHKTIRINVNDIVGFDKHPDVVYRYYKKLFLKTATAHYLINYNISDESDELLLTFLGKLVER